MTVKEQMVRIVHDCENDTCETCQWFNGVVGCQEPKSTQILSLLIEEIKKVKFTPEDRLKIFMAYYSGAVDITKVGSDEYLLQAYRQKIIDRLEE